MYDAKKFQKEVGHWAAYNFPSAQPWMPLLGVVEEVGELEEAILAHDRDLIHDSIGDMAVFLAHYGCKNGLDFLVALEHAREEEFVIAGSIHQLHIRIGRLAHCHLKYAQKIRNIKAEDVSVAYQKVASSLVHLCTLYGCFDTIVENTWEKVKKRNWRRKNAD